MNKPSSPKFSTSEIQDFAKSFYGIEASAQQLDSYIDQNFLLTDLSGKKYIFKIANKAERKDILDLQNQAMDFLNQQKSFVRFPKIIQTKNGEEIVTIQDNDKVSYYIRILSFLDGIFLSNISQPNPELLYEFGSALGAMDKSLADFYHPAAFRSVEWDLKGVGDLFQQTHHIQDSNQKRLLEYFICQFEMEVLPVLPQLRESIIHNDANDYNILVEENEAGDKSVCGIIDFGDMVYTHTIFELAIATTYVMFGKDDPLQAAAPLIKGYHEVFPVTEQEIDILFFLISTRLCMSVIASTMRKNQEPDNEYITISEKPAWELLAKFLEINPIAARNTFRNACGFSKPDKINGFTRKKILGIREEHFGKSLSVSYKKPLKIVRGAMQYLFDDKGNTFLDCVNNVCHVGHCHPRVVKAAQKQIAMLNTNTRYLHDYLAQYAQRLTAKLPDPLNVCYFVNSGSEANDLALRLAWTHTGQKDIIVVDGAYHGNLSSLVDISPYKFDGPGGKGAPEHVHKVSMPDPYRDKEKTSSTPIAERYANEVQHAISEIQGNQKGVAGFICESLLSCGGQIVLPKNYLNIAFQFVRDAGGVCIADEVQIGFGRVGSFFWGFETQGVVPDIVTLGKPIGNGHPLGAVVTTPEIAESFNTGMEYFNTYGGNPVSCAVGLAVLDVIETDNLQNNADKVGKYLKSGLQKLMEKFPLIGDVRGLGLFLGVELVLDRETLEPAAKEAKMIIEEMKNRGILLSIDGPLYNVLKIKPPLVFIKKNADSIIQNLDEVLSEI